MQDDIRPQIQRLLQIRGHEGVVHNHNRPILVGDPCDCRNIVDLQQRVRQGFEIHSLGGLAGPILITGDADAADRRLERLVIIGVHGLADQSPTGEMLVELRVGAAVNVAADDDPVARLENRKNRVDGGEPGRERETASAVFELRNLALKEVTGRVAAARVIPAGHGLDRFESIRG